MEQLRVLKEIYSVECVVKAIANFLSVAYFHIDVEGKYWLINFKMKDDSCNNFIKSELENELLAQAVRFQVYKQTKNIREMLVARAVSTSLVDKDASEKLFANEKYEVTKDELNDILKDWFDK